MKFLLGINMKNRYLMGEINLWWGESSRRNFSRQRDEQIFGLWGHSPPVGKTLQSGRDFLMAETCLISIVLNGNCIVLLSNSQGESTMEDPMNNRLPRENIGDGKKYFENSPPKNFINVFCFWIHSKNLLLFWVFLLQINNNSCPDKQL